MDTNNKKAVYTIIERHEGEAKKSFWVRIGAAFTNRDGSQTVKLDALPVNGVLQVRDWPTPGDWRARNEQTTQAPASRTHADIFAGA